MSGRLTILLVLILTVRLLSAQDHRKADSIKSVLQRQDLTTEVRRNLLADLIRVEGRPDELLYYSNELIADAARDSSLSFLATALLQKGNAYRLTGDYEPAFACYFQALQFATRIDDEVTTIAVSVSIADTYSVLGDSENASTYYQRGIGLMRKGVTGRDSLLLGSSIFNAGDELLKSEKLDSARQYFLEAQLIFNRLNYETGEAYAVGSTGLVYAEQGKYSLAEASLKEATEIFAGLDDPYSLSEYQYHLAEIYLIQNKLPSAALNAESSLLHAQSVGLKEQIRNSSKILSQIYERQGKPSEALAQLKTYNLYRDSLNNESVIQGMEQQRRQFEVAQKQLEVNLLSQEKKLQQIIGIGLVVVLLLGLVVLWITYRDAQRKKKLNRELSLLNETKDKFFSIISHDLRGPISAFYGISRIIRSYIQREQYDNLLEMTDQIDDSVRSVSSLLDNLLGWAVQQQGHFPYNPRKIVLDEMCKNIFQVFKTTADAKNIQLRSDIPSKLSIWADYNSANTILRNLVSNALKFTPEGGTISVTTAEKNGEAVIEVTDTGIGMTTEVVDKLFQLSDRKSTFGTAGEKGLGLGLQLVHEFTQLNKGTIAVQSDVGKGSTFTVRLPVATRVKEVLMD